jgi:hypothetical protein
MNELIRQQITELIGKKIKVFFKYSNVTYNIKKSGVLIGCDEKFFVVDEIKDGRSTYSYDFVSAVMEDKE